jgi:hypothetical protein
MAQDLLSSRPYTVNKARPLTSKPKKKKKDDIKTANARPNRGNYLRSTRLGSHSAKNVARVNSALKDLQIPETPTPTARVCKGLLSFFF